MLNYPYLRLSSAVEAAIESAVESATNNGEILFWDASAGKWVCTEDTELFWDDVNKRLGVGTAVPDEKLHLTGNSAALKLEDDSGNWARVKVGNSQLTFAADPDNEVPSTDIVFDMDGAEVARFQQGGEFRSLDAIIAKKGFATQLWDIAGGNWETAEVDTEYYSPNQQGGIYGTIYRQYFNTSLPSNLTSGNNVSALIDYIIQFMSEGTNLRGIAHGAASATGTSDKRCAIWLTGATGNNNLQIDKEASGDDYEPVKGWVDYTK